MQADIFELNDPAGRAADDTEIEACVLTKEVEKGGLIINDLRKKNGLPEVVLVFADMVMASEDGDSEGVNFSNKISSTIIRRHLEKMTK